MADLQALRKVIRCVAAERPAGADSKNRKRRIEERRRFAAAQSLGSIRAFAHTGADVRASGLKERSARGGRAHAERPKIHNARGAQRRRPRLASARSLKAVSGYRRLTYDLPLCERVVDPRGPKVAHSINGTWPFEDIGAAVQAAALKRRPIGGDRNCPTDGRRTNRRRRIERRRRFAAARRLAKVRTYADTGADLRRYPV